MLRLLDGLGMAPSYLSYAAAAIVQKRSRREPPCHVQSGKHRRCTRAVQAFGPKAHRADLANRQLADRA